MGHGPKGAKLGAPSPKVVRGRPTSGGAARGTQIEGKLVNYSTKALNANILNNVVVETFTIVKCLKSLNRHIIYTKT